MGNVSVVTALTSSIAKSIKNFKCLSSLNPDLFTLMDYFYMLLSHCLNHLIWASIILTAYTILCKTLEPYFYQYVWRKARGGFVLVWGGMKLWTRIMIARFRFITQCDILIGKPTMELYQSWIGLTDPGCEHLSHFDREQNNTQPTSKEELWMSHKKPWKLFLKTT